MQKVSDVGGKVEGRVSSDIRASEPRICMPIISSFARNVYRTGVYEAQDVIASCDDVQLIPLEPSKDFGFKEKWLSRVLKHDVTRKLAFLNPGLRAVRLTRDYDLFLHICAEFSDVLYANAVEGWRDRCKTSVCWISEFWAHHLPEREYLFPVLSQFDHVIIGTDGSGKSLGERIQRPCYEIVGGVDTIRFSPYPSPSPRVIDVYSIGRRWEGIHRSLLKMAAGKKIFYVHDTLDNVGYCATKDYREHRDHYANMAKRSRFFMVAEGKVNFLVETAGQVSPGLRYYEGLAAGSVLIGQAPDCESFRRDFDWKQPVIEIQSDGSDAAEVISKLITQPDRLREISCRNAEKALRRHDWVYVWKRILEIVGLKQTTAMEARVKRLHELADMARENGRSATGEY
jgi:hypothetical protein